MNQLQEQRYELKRVSLRNKAARLLRATHNPRISRFTKLKNLFKPVDLISIFIENINLFHYTGNENIRLTSNSFIYKNNIKVSDVISLAKELNIDNKILFLFLILKPNDRNAIYNNIEKYILARELDSDQILHAFAERLVLETTVHYDLEY